MRNIVSNANDAIDALGGTRRVSMLLEVSDQVVCNWRDRGFPSHRYRDIAPLLRRKGIGFRPGIFTRMGQNGR